MDGITNHITSSYDQYRVTLITAITTAVLLLVTLAWNDMIQTALLKYYPKEDATITGKMKYAFVITFIVVLLQIYVLPMFMDKK